MSEETFAVYVTAIPFVRGEDHTKDATKAKEAGGLGAKAAVELARRCSERVMMGRVVIVCEQDDSTVFEWHYEQGVTWPPKK